ncbi:hypothetical protein D3C86_1689280 [compost metagenome]
MAAMGGKWVPEMLSESMASLIQFHLRTGAVTLGLAVASVMSGCATITQAPTAKAACPTTFVTFVGFGEGVADIQQDGKALWQGRIAQYDPSTDISAQAQICAEGSREIVVHAAGKTYRASLPANQQPYFVLIDSRSAEPTIQGRPFLFD